MPIKRLERGLVHIITGDGPGKTTSALGLCLRAIGHGLRACVIQFMKAGVAWWEEERCEVGEVVAARYLPNFTILSFGREAWFSEDEIDEERKYAERGLKTAREIVRSGKYDVVVLDEVNMALHYGLLSMEDVIDLIKIKPPHVELILTGRNAPEELYELADYVVEIRKIKHPFDRNVRERRGIEY
ncbi:MAG: cob(I)yrinic acid a,c-diamide adenosyltransferase [Thermoproteota archaeon]|nr:MAG: cob(I)yrinic acid a,c-diamide adenosyltransferase [Candidatus Korarchaeota archaeon]